MYTYFTGALVFSLNQRLRQKQTVNIVTENERIVNRFLRLKPNYDRKRLMREWEEREILSKRISRYPHTWKERSNQVFIMSIGIWSQ